MVKTNCMCWEGIMLLIQTDLKFIVQLHMLASIMFHMERILKYHLTVIYESKYLAPIAILGELSCILLCSIAFNSEQS